MIFKTEGLIWVWYVNNYMSEAINVLGIDCYELKMLTESQHAMERVNSDLESETDPNLFDQ